MEVTEVVRKLLLKTPLQYHMEVGTVPMDWLTRVVVPLVDVLLLLVYLSAHSS